jgi:AraC family transcriptional regulator
MNKSHSWTDYQKRLSRVTAYIHDHLAEELDLNRLAAQGLARHATGAAAV